MVKVRFLVPAGETGSNDLVHGPITVDNKHIEDFVLSWFSSWAVSTVLGELRRSDKDDLLCPGNGKNVMEE